MRENGRADFDASFPEHPVTPPLTIPLLVPDLPSLQELLPYFQRIEDNRHYSNFGPLVAELETRIAQRFTSSGGGCMHAVTTSSATTAIEIALQSLALPAGAPVLVPAFGFAAAASVVQKLGHALHFMDVDAARWECTPAIARQMMAAVRPAAVIVISPFGYPVDPLGWDELAAQTGVPVIIDAAAGFGNQQVSSGVATIFSMHATKAFGAGEGGVVVVSDADAAHHLRRISNFGFQDRVAQHAGTNAKLSEWHAAVALAQLARMDDVIRSRRQVLAGYQEEFAGYSQLAWHPDAFTAAVPAFMPVAAPDRDSARALVAGLAAAGIDSRTWFAPALTLHPAFAAAAARRNGPPMLAESLAERIVCLPFHANLTQHDIAYIARTTRDSLDRHLAGADCQARTAG